MIEQHRKRSIGDIRRSLLAAIICFADQVTLPKTLRWLLLKQSALERRRRGRPPEPSIDPKWSTEELQTKIISAALHLANISDGRSRQSLFAALHYYRSEWRHQQVRRPGRRPVDGLASTVLVARHRFGAKSVADTARGLVKEGRFKNQRKAEDFVAYTLGIREKKSNNSNGSSGPTPRIT
jgi:hypothetical protein